jgi:diguanylate cyclase (GGDEF)-like protein
MTKKQFLVYTGIIGSILVLVEVLAVVQYTMLLGLSPDWKHYALPAVVGVLFGTAMVLFYHYFVLAKSNELLATTDRLTGAMNRYASELIFAHDAKRCLRNDTPFSLLLLDVDDFKKINDTHGHTAGDRVLQGLSDVVQSQIRDADSYCRWGGEEFLIFLPEIDFTQVKQLGERLCKSVESADFGLPHRVTMSVGGVTVKQVSLDLNALVARADQALYFVKENGKNRVAMYCEVARQQG